MRQFKRDVIMPIRMACLSFFKTLFTIKYPDPKINKQLGQKTRWLRLILSNQLTDKLAHNDREFKAKLCECIGSKVELSSDLGLMLSEITCNNV
jgi:hypothetical protein